MKHVLLCLGLLLCTWIGAEGIATKLVKEEDHDSTIIDEPNKHQYHHRRPHVLRRLHGPENDHVRKSIRLLEEQMTYSQTGVLGDPSHMVPYENHPFQATLDSRRRRQLQDGTTSSSNFTFAPNYSPLRIRFDTQALDLHLNSSNAAMINFLKNQVLARTATFWSDVLSVVPVAGGPLRISPAELKNQLYCGDEEFSIVPNEHIDPGINDTDLILYISASPSRFCSYGMPMVGVACNFDQYDRPTAGNINICLDQLSLDIDSDLAISDAVLLQEYVDIAVHQVGHILGHNSFSWRFFWDSETGVERTARPFVPRTVTCVDNVERTLLLPSENTLRFSQQPSNGQRYASIVTPKVRAVARNQFDCQSLPGAKLENQPATTSDNDNNVSSSSSFCTGEHWEEHDYYPEALSGVMSPTNTIVSHLTLALLEDSGWYQANYNQGTISPWGLGAGCSFVEEPCLITDAATPSEPVLPEYSQGYFCKGVTERGCSATLTHKLACTVLDYAFLVPVHLPGEHFQYFPEEPTKGGPRQADFCPLFGSTYNGLDVEGLACEDSTNAAALNLYSEVYGPDSQCIRTESGEARCYRTACVMGDMTLKINVRGEWLTCEFDFQKLNVRVGAGAFPQIIVCPRFSTACPELFSCPLACSGRGVCNYAGIADGMIQPQCNCFDPTDTSPGCSDSMIPRTLPPLVTNTPTATPTTDYINATFSPTVTPPTLGPTVDLTNTSAGPTQNATVTSPPTTATISPTLRPTNLTTTSPTFSPSSPPNTTTLAPTLKPTNLTTTSPTVSPSVTVAVAMTEPPSIDPESNSAFASHAWDFSIFNSIGIASLVSAHFLF